MCCFFNLLVVLFYKINKAKSKSFQQSSGSCLVIHSGTYSHALEFSQVGYCAFFFFCIEKANSALGHMLFPFRSELYWPTQQMEKTCQHKSICLFARMYKWVCVFGCMLFLPYLLLRSVLHAGCRSSAVHSGSCKNSMSNE